MEKSKCCEECAYCQCINHNHSLLHRCLDKSCPCHTNCGKSEKEAPLTFRSGEDLLKPTPDSVELKGNEIRITSSKINNQSVSDCQPIVNKSEKCEHEWIDARNEVVKNGYYCKKCRALSIDGIKAISTPPISNEEWWNGIEEIINEIDFEGSYINEGMNKLKLYISNLISSVESKSYKEGLAEPHETKLGYCCACDYDIACMKGEIEEAEKSGREAERERLSKIVMETAELWFLRLHNEPGIWKVDLALSDLLTKIGK